MTAGDGQPLGNRARHQTAVRQPRIQRGRAGRNPVAPVPPSRGFQMADLLPQCLYRGNRNIPGRSPGEVAPCRFHGSSLSVVHKVLPKHPEHLPECAGRSTSPVRQPLRRKRSQNTASVYVCTVSESSRRRPQEKAVKPGNSWRYPGAINRPCPLPADARGPNAAKAERPSGRTPRPRTGAGSASRQASRQASRARGCWHREPGTR